MWARLLWIRVVAADEGRWCIRCDVDGAEIGQIWFGCSSFTTTKNYYNFSRFYRKQVYFTRFRFGDLWEEREESVGGT